MVVTRQIMKQGRYNAPPGIDMAVRNALARLPQRRQARPAVSPRRIALAACAVVLVCGVAIASIPQARAYAEGLLRSVFKLYAGEPDNGIVTAPVASETPSMYEQQEQAKYKILSMNSVPVNVSQTSNGVTATVLEAAIAQNRLFLGFEFNGLPQYCFPAEEVIHVWVDGKQMDTGNTRKASSAGTSDIFTVDHPLTIKQEDLPDNFTVRLSFNLRQFPDGGYGQGSVIATFDLSFNMDKPTVFATLPPGSADEITKVEGPNEGPPTTSMPQYKGINPQDDPNLVEPKGVTDWAVYKNTQAGISFEYPKDWKQITNALPMPGLDNAKLLCAYNGDESSFAINAVKLDATNLAEAAGLVNAKLAALHKNDYEGSEYDVTGGQVYFMFGLTVTGRESSLIIVKPNEPLLISGESYNYLLIGSLPEYNAHILKTLVIQQSGTPQEQSGTPQSGGLNPQDDPNLTEPKGVADWATYENSQAGVSFEYPKAWAPIYAPNILKSNGVVLSAYKGDHTGLIIYAVQLDVKNPTEAADFVTAYLLKEGTEEGGTEGRKYNVVGGQVYFLHDIEGAIQLDASGAVLTKSYRQSYIIVKLSKPISIDGKTYNYLLIWAPMDYSAHMLKTLVIN